MCEPYKTTGLKSNVQSTFSATFYYVYFVHMHKIILVRMYHFSGVIQSLQDPRHKIYEIFKFPFHIHADIRRFDRPAFLQEARCLALYCRWKWTV